RVAERDRALSPQGNPRPFAAQFWTGLHRQDFLPGGLSFSGYNLLQKSAAGQTLSQTLSSPALFRWSFRQSTSATLRPVGFPLRNHLEKSETSGGSRARSSA